tara:strand:+ start:457 stop:609 length:153 start_codon:yes stop_codon:yes gene_type:complete
MSSYIKVETCPYAYKYQLVQWAVTYKGLKKHKAQQIPKNALYAMWYNRNK